MKDKRRAEKLARYLAERSRGPARPKIPRRLPRGGRGPDVPLLWHYTTRKWLELILRDGEIKPATEGVLAGERPAVWFSRNQTFEPTAAKGVVSNGVLRDATPEDIQRLTGGYCRIGVRPDVAPHGWDAFVRLSGITPRFANGLILVGEMLGADHEEWFVAFGPVPGSRWSAVEVLTDAGWRPADFWRAPAP